MALQNAEEQSTSVGVRIATVTAAKNQNGIFHNMLDLYGEYDVHRGVYTSFLFCVSGEEVYVNSPINLVPP